MRPNKYHLCSSGPTVGIEKAFSPVFSPQVAIIVPATIPALNKLGLSVIVESGVGVESGFTDETYRNRNATVCETRDEVFKQADIVLQVQYLGAAGDPGRADVSRFRDGQVVIGSCDPLTFPEPVRDLADRGATGFSLELVPRITRAQSMDVLSSMATLRRYRHTDYSVTANTHSHLMQGPSSRGGREKG